MSSSAHLSKELHQLIKEIGETRSKQEEDKIIVIDQQKLKNVLSTKKNIKPKKMQEYLIRAIYIEMLGHDASFAHVAAINLTQAKKKKYKAMGYLAASLFLSEESPMILLLVATLQKDLSSKDPSEVIMALTTVSKILSEQLVNPLLDSTLRLLQNTKNEFIRKKAYCVLLRMHEIKPEAVPDVQTKMRNALCDIKPSIMGIALHFYYQEIKRDPIKYKELTSSFVVILKQIIEHRLEREYDYHRLPAPWLQIRLLQILGMLGANDIKVSEQMYEILNLALKRADDTGVNIGLGVTYQCIKTICQIYPNSELLELAASSISKFLDCENNNLKYLGINALISIVAINPKFALDHQLTVVDCLESSDQTLQRETLDLLFKMTNSQNVKVIVDKLLKFLKSTNDKHFKKDLVKKISILSERYAPDHKWFIQNMNLILEFGSDYLGMSELKSLLKLIDENFKLHGPEFGKFVFQAFEKQLTQPKISDLIIKEIAWVFGGLGLQIYGNDQVIITKLINQLIDLLNNKSEDNLTKSWLLNSIAKLSRAESFNDHELVDGIFRQYSSARNLELQQRCREYLFLKTQRQGLIKNTDFRIDKTLSFLKPFVDAALQHGAKKKSDVTLIKMVEFMNITGGNDPSTTAGSDLKLSHNQPQRTVAQPNKNQENQVQQSQGLKVQQQKWGEEGYKEEQSKREIARNSQVNVQKSFSNNLDMEKGKQANHITSQQSNLGSISSKDYGKTTYSAKPAWGQGGFPDKQEEAKHEHELEEKKKKASNLFGGMQEDQSGGLFAGMMELKPEKVEQKVEVEENIDLFGFGDTEEQAQPQKVIKQPEQPPSDDFDLLDIGSNPVIQQQQQPDPMDLFNTPVQQQPQQQPVQVLRPHVINMQQYEQSWVQFPQEVMKSYQQTKIQDVFTFRTFCQQQGIQIVKEIGTEVICSSVGGNGQPLLLYAKILGGGNIDIQFKSQDQSLLQAATESIGKNIH